MLGRALLGVFRCPVPILQRTFRIVNSKAPGIIRFYSDGESVTCNSTEFEFNLTLEISLFIHFFLEAELLYKPLCPSVWWLVGRGAISFLGRF